MWKSTLIILACITLASAKVPISPRVIGGVATDIRNYPYLVSVQNSSRHICGGAIISKDHILTSFSCVLRILPDLILVRVGSTFHNTGGTVISATKLNTHVYVNNSLNDDIAILVLQTSLEFNINVSTIKLPTSTQNLIQNQYGTLAGWGSTNPNSALFDGLLKTDLYVILPATCRPRFGIEELITDSMFCAGTYYRHICNGDYGGPLVSNNELIGIAIKHRNCGRDNLPAIFTDVSKYSDLIKAFITKPITQLRQHKS